MTADLRALLEQVTRVYAPRILTQLCRDPTSPLYGCADRNWWHYKIRDFPSIILQQAGYAMHLAAQLPPWRDDAGSLEALAAASARFWNQRALKHHAFEEYYPWEQGYPPLAFSTLAVAKLADAGAVPLEDVQPGLSRAARQLRARFEDKAGNQQVAGLAALAWVDRLLPGEADPAAFAAQKARTLALQHEEGWYWEYDGPDLGYLAVTIDCLWDLFDATGDADYKASIERALAFMRRFVHAAPHGVGLHNSRNTDYLVPYGIIRSALAGSEDAAAVAHWAFGRADAHDHFFAAVDDRYLCHYIGQSVFRAVGLLQQAAIAAPTPFAPPPALLAGSGHFLDEGLIVSCRKGGIVTMTSGPAVASDFGWIVQRGTKQFVSHWWSDAWAFSTKDGAVEIEGQLFPHAEKVSTPAKHIVLRLLSLLLGRRLIGLLKRVLIFKRGGDGPRLRRCVERSDGILVVTDQITGLRPGDELLRAPRASKRHVASADSAHGEDLSLTRGFAVERESKQEPDAARFVTHYRPLVDAVATSVATGR
jgi:hypothetical protein